MQPSLINNHKKPNTMQSNNFLATPTTMKISTTVYQPVEVDREIELPYYFKDKYWHYKVYAGGPDSFLTIQTSDKGFAGQQQISLTKLTAAQMFEGFLSSEDEFNEALQFALTKIAEASGEVVSIMFYNEMPKP